MDLPVISITKAARRYLRKNGAAVYLRKHPKAGHSGYSPDMLQALLEMPQKGLESAIRMEQDGFTIYFDASMAIEKYDQIDLWTIRKYWLFTQLKARITLYRRLVFDPTTKASA